MRRRWNAHAHEYLHEGAGLHAHLIPRPERHQHRHCAHVKNQNAPDYLIDGLRYGLVGIFRLACGDTDKLNTAEGEHHHSRRKSQSPKPMGQETAVCPQVAEIVGERPGAAQQEIQPQHNHQHDGGDFYECHPKFRFPVQPHVDEVQCRNGHQTDKRRNPLRQIWEPELHIDTYRRKLGHGHQNVIEPIIPAGHKAWKPTPVFCRVMAERAGHRLVHRHFAQHPHDEENHDAAD